MSIPVVPVNAPVLPIDVADYLGQADESPYGEVLPVVMAFVRNFTRGRGFDPEGRPNIDLWAVCVTAAAREVNIRDHHGLQREEVGSYSVYLGPNSSDFSTRELAVMRSYRIGAT